MIALFIAGLCFFAYNEAMKQIVDSRIKADLFNPESYKPNFYKRIKNGYIVWYFCEDMRGDTMPCIDTVYFNKVNHN